MFIDRSRIRKDILVSDQPLPGYTLKREPLPVEFEHLEQDCRGIFTPSITNVGPRRRLEAVRQQLDGF